MDLPCWGGTLAIISSKATPAEEEQEKKLSKYRKFVMAQVATTYVIKKI
jgi:hypothetical protein